MPSGIILWEGVLGEVRRSTPGQRPGAILVACDGPGYASTRKGSSTATCQMSHLDPPQLELSGMSRCCCQRCCRNGSSAGSRCCTSLLYGHEKGHPHVVRMASELVGVAGFEPAASSSRTKRAAKLRHTPMTAAEV
jgi:hypothetical protein